MTDQESAAGAAPDSAQTAATAEPEPEPEPEKEVDERTRVLRMLSEGRISVDEAVELLKALGPEVEVVEERRGPGPWGAWGAWAPSGSWGPWGQWGPWGPWGQTPQGAPGAYAPRAPTPPTPPSPPGPFGQQFQQRIKQGLAPHMRAQVKGIKRGTTGRPGEADVVFNVGVPGPPGVPMPPMPFVSPVPPVPAVPPVPPIPPVPPNPWMTNRVLVFEIEYEGNTYTARLPIGLVGDVNRFLPRQARQVLDEFEIDVDQLAELVNGIDLESGAPLINIEHDRNHVKVRIE